MVLLYVLILVDTNVFVVYSKYKNSVHVGGRDFSASVVRRCRNMCTALLRQDPFFVLQTYMWLCILKLVKLGLCSFLILKQCVVFDGWENTVVGYLEWISLALLYDHL